MEGDLKRELDAPIFYIAYSDKEGSFPMSYRGLIDYFQKKFDLQSFSRFKLYKLFDNFTDDELEKFYNINQFDYMNEKYPDTPRNIQYILMKNDLIGADALTFNEVDQMFAYNYKKELEGKKTTSSIRNDDQIILHDDDHNYTWKEVRNELMQKFQLSSLSDDEIDNLLAVKSDETLLNLFNFDVDYAVSRAYPNVTPDYQMYFLKRDLFGDAGLTTTEKISLDNYIKEYGKPTPLPDDDPQQQEPQPEESQQEPQQQPEEQPEEAQQAEEQQEPQPEEEPQQAKVRHSEDFYVRSDDPRYISIVDQLLPQLDTDLDTNDFSNTDDAESELLYKDEKGELSDRTTFLLFWFLHDIRTSFQHPVLGIMADFFDAHFEDDFSASSDLVHFAREYYTFIKPLWQGINSVNTQLPQDIDIDFTELDNLFIEDLFNVHFVSTSQLRKDVDNLKIAFDAFFADDFVIYIDKFKDAVDKLNKKIETEKPKKGKEVPEKVDIVGELTAAIYNNIYAQVFMPDPDAQSRFIGYLEKATLDIKALQDDTFEGKPNSWEKKSTDENKNDNVRILYPEEDFTQLSEERRKKEIEYQVRELYKNRSQRDKDTNTKPLLSEEECVKYCITTFINDKDALKLIIDFFNDVVGNNRPFTTLNYSELAELKRDIQDKISLLKPGQFPLVENDIDNTITDIMNKMKTFDAAKSEISKIYEDLVKKNKAELRDNIKKLYKLQYGKDGNETEINMFTDSLIKEMKNWNEISEMITRNLQKFNAENDSQVEKLANFYETSFNFSNEESKKFAEERIIKLKEMTTDISQVDQKIEEDIKLFGKIQLIKADWEKSLISDYHVWNPEELIKQVKFDMAKLYDWFDKLFRRLITLSSYLPCFIKKQFNDLASIPDYENKSELLDKWIEKFETRKNDFLKDPDISVMITDPETQRKLKITPEEIAGHCKTKEDVDYYIKAKDYYLKKQYNLDGSTSFTRELYKEFEEKYYADVVEANASMAQFYTMLFAEAPIGDVEFNKLEESYVNKIFKAYNAADEKELDENILKREDYYVKHSPDLRQHNLMYLQTEAIYPDFLNYHPEYKNNKSLASLLKSNSQYYKMGSNAEYKAMRQILSEYEKLNNKYNSILLHPQLNTLIKELQENDPDNYSYYNIIRNNLDKSNQYIYNKLMGENSIMENNIAAQNELKEQVQIWNQTFTDCFVDSRTIEELLGSPKVAANAIAAFLENGDYLDEYIRMTMHKGKFDLIKFITKNGAVKVASNNPMTNTGQEVSREVVTGYDYKKAIKFLRDSVDERNNKVTTAFADPKIGDLYNKLISNGFGFYTKDQVDADGNVIARGQFDDEKTKNFLYDQYVRDEKNNLQKGLQCQLYIDIINRHILNDQKQKVIDINKVNNDVSDAYEKKLKSYVDNIDWCERSPELEFYKRIRDDLKTNEWRSIPDNFYLLDSKTILQEYVNPTLRTYYEKLVNQSYPIDSRLSAEEVYKDLYGKITKIEMKKTSLDGATDLRQMIEANQKTLSEYGWNENFALSGDKDINTISYEVKRIIKEKEYKEKFKVEGAISDEEYRKCTTESEKVDWLSKQLFKYDTVKSEFDKSEMEDLYTQYKPGKIMTDLDKLKLMRDSNYDPREAKIIMNHKIALRKYKEEFNENFPTTNDKKNYKEETNKINKLIEKHKAFLNNQQLEEVLKQCRTHFGRTYQAEEFWDTYKKENNINNIILELKYELYLDKLDGLNYKGDSFGKTEAGLRDMEKKIAELESDSKSFDSPTFAWIIADYKKYYGLPSYSVGKAKSEFGNNFNKAFNTLTSKNTQYVLMKDYGYTQEEINKFVSANDDNATRINLLNELDRVKKDKKDAEKDDNLITLLGRINSRRSSGKVSLDYLFEKHGHNKQKVLYYLYIEDYKEKIGYNMTEDQIKQKFPSETFASSISELIEQINLYDRRFIKYSENSELNKLLGKIKNTKTKNEIIRELICKFIKTESDAESLKNAIRDVKNVKRIDKYNDINEKTGIGKLEFDKDTSDIVKEERLKERKEKIRELKRNFDSPAMKKILKIRTDLGGSTFQDWKEIAKTYNQDYEKAEIDLQKWNYEHLFANEFGEQFDYNLSRSTDDEKKLEEIKNIWDTYSKFYKKNIPIKLQIEEYNKIVRKEDKTNYKKLIEEYGSDTTECSKGLQYDINMAKLRKIRGNVDNGAYAKEDLERLESEVALETYNKSKFYSTDFTKLLADYNARYPGDRLDSDKARTDFRNNYNDAVNWITSYNKIYDFNEYSNMVNYDYKLVRQQYANSSEFLMRLTNEFRKYMTEFEKLRYMDNVEELYDYYISQHNNVADLRDIFNNNGKDAEKAYRVMLIEYYNMFYPENPLENKELTLKDMKKDRQKIWVKIRKAKEIKEETDKDDELKTLFRGKTQNEINTLIAKYKTKEDIKNHLQIEEQLEIYNNIRKEEDQLNEEELLKKFKLRGESPADLVNYLKEVNKQFNNGALMSEYDKYYKKNGGEKTFDQIAQEQKIPYEIRAFILLEPIRIRYMSAYGETISIHQMLYQFKYNIDEAYDYFEKKTVYGEFLDEFPKDDLLKKKKGYNVFDTFIKKSDADAYLDKMREKLRGVHDIVQDDVGGELINYNSGKNETDRISNEDVYGLSRSKEDVKIILNILRKLESFNQKTGSNFNKDTIKKLLSDQQHPDWITAYQKVVLLPILNDYNNVAQKSKLTSKNMSSVLKELKLDENRTVEAVDQAAVVFEKQVNDLKKKYLQKFFDEYNAVASTSFPNIDYFLERHPDFVEAEKFLRLNKFIEQINQTNEYVRQNYKFIQTKDENYADYEKEISWFNREW